MDDYNLGVLPIQYCPSLVLVLHRRNKLAHQMAKWLMLLVFLAFLLLVIFLLPVCIQILLVINSCSILTQKKKNKKKKKKKKKNSLLLRFGVLSRTIRASPVKMKFCRESSLALVRAKSAAVASPIRGSVNKTLFVQALKIWPLK